MQVRHGNNGANARVADLGKGKRKEQRFADEIAVIAGRDVPEVVGVAEPRTEANPVRVFFVLNSLPAFFARAPLISAFISSAFPCPIWFTAPRRSLSSSSGS